MISSTAISGDDRAVVKFATIQLFALIYLQKFAIGPVSMQLSIPMLIMFVSLLWMGVTQRIGFSLSRLAVYLIFVSCCMVSQQTNGFTGSLPSIIELFALYGYFTISASLSEDGYERVLDGFVKMMMVPAVIVLFQYCYQKLTGLSDPVSMTHLVPKALLQQGFSYEAHYPWNSPFMRPNGFFFLEPSFVSAFSATAAIIEITFFRRAGLIALMLGSTAFSLGGTGMVMLISAAPFLLVRERRSIAVSVIALALVAITVAYFLSAQLPLISRLGELDQTNSSASSRLLIPATSLVKLITDPSYMIAGTGAGSTLPDLGTPWPVLKLLNEYGLLSSVSFCVLYLTGAVGAFNLPLKVALSLIFNFTGGYLLNPVMVELIAILFFITPPRDQLRFARVSGTRFLEAQQDRLA